MLLSLALLLIEAAYATAAADCTCRARGVTATHGQTLCIRTPDGTRLARCEKVSNVSSWRFLTGACPVAAIPLAIAASSTRPADYLR